MMRSQTFNSDECDENPLGLIIVKMMAIGFLSKNVRVARVVINLLGHLEKNFCWGISY